MNKNAIQGRFWPSKRHGFTLIELLVVVLIIGVLAAVALPQYQKAVLKARYQQAVILGNLFYDAQKTYYLEHGVYAKSFDDFIPAMPQPTRQETTSTYTAMVYPWGNCAMRYIDPDLPDIQCRTKNNMVYEVGLSGIRRCFAYDEIGKALCQAETGHEPYYQSTDYWGWNY